MRLDFHQRAEVAQHVHDALAGLEAVHTAKLRRHPIHRVTGAIHARLGVHNDRCAELVTHADFEVVRIVRRRDFHGTAAERRVGVVVGDHRNAHPVDRQDEHFSDQRGVAFVGGIHGHCHVAEQRLGPRRRHHNASHRVVSEVIANVVERALRLVELGLFVGERGETAWTPVDHAMAAIHQAFLKQTHEGFGHGLRQRLGQRVGRARPVGAGADRLELTDDLAARGFDKMCGPTDECFAAERRARRAFGGENLLHRILRRDAGVIGSGHPECFVTGHAAPANQHILHTVVEPMTDMQNRRHIRRRHHNRVRIAITAAARHALGVTDIRSGGLPPRVQRPLNVGRAVGRRQVVRGRTSRCCSEVSHGHGNPKPNPHDLATAAGQFVAACPRTSSRLTTVCTPIVPRVSVVARRTSSGLSTQPVSSMMPVPIAPMSIGRSTSTGSFRNVSSTRASSSASSFAGRRGVRAVRIGRTSSCNAVRRRVGSGASPRFMPRRSRRTPERIPRSASRIPTAIPAMAPIRTAPNRFVPVDSELFLRRTNRICFFDGS